MLNVRKKYAKTSFYGIDKINPHKISRMYREDKISRRKNFFSSFVTRIEYKIS